MSQSTDPEDAVEPMISSGSSQTITFRRSHFFLALLPISFVCGLAAGFLLAGRVAVTGDEDQLAGRGVNTAVPQATPVQRFNVSADDDPFLGPERATVTIIEFSDFECAYCVRFYRDTLMPLLETYPAEVRVVYRDFPLENIHPNARPAAEASQCAFAQGKFWEFHNQLFENQNRMGDQLYADIAADIGLDTAAFEECYLSGAFSEEVSRDFNAGRALGVTGTPTFFVNGRVLVGAQPLQNFLAVIEEELAASR